MTALPPDLRVLIVEDEAIIAMTAEDMLADLGCTVAAIASNLAEGLVQIESESFDVVLLDINLNGTVSTPIADRLAELGKAFVFTTGYGSSDLPDAHDARPVVMKPYQLSQLEEGLIRALAR